MARSIPGAALVTATAARIRSARAVSWANTAPGGGSGDASSGWTRIGAFGGSSTMARIETGSGRVAFDVTVDTLGALVRYTSSGACRGELSVAG